MGNKYHLQYKAKGNASLWVECKAEMWNSSPEDNFGMVGLDCQDLNLQYSKPLRTLSPQNFFFVCLFFYLFACLFVFFSPKERAEGVVLAFWQDIYHFEQVCLKYIHV